MIRQLLRGCTQALRRNDILIQRRKNAYNAIKFRNLSYFTKRKAHKVTMCRSSAYDHSLIHFWLSIQNEYLVVKNKEMLKFFRKTYLSERGFSTYNLENKYRNRLNVKPDLRLKLSDLEPNFNYIVPSNTYKYPTVFTILKYA